MSTNPKLDAVGIKTNPKLDAVGIKQIVDPIQTPTHYARWTIEPITFIMANHLPYAIGNVIKYVLRYDAKDGLQDLKKARRYIDMIIEKEYGKENV